MWKTLQRDVRRKVSIEDFADDASARRSVFVALLDQQLAEPIRWIDWSEGMVVGGIILRHRLGNVDDLNALTSGAFEIVELISRPEHHLSQSMRSVTGFVEADSASQRSRPA
jgi:hypothetical protein